MKDETLQSWRTATPAAKAAVVTRLATERRLHAVHAPEAAQAFNAALRVLAEAHGTPLQLELFP